MCTLLWSHTQVYMYMYVHVNGFVCAKSGGLWSLWACSRSPQKLFCTKLFVHRISIVKTRWSLTSEIVKSSFHCTPYIYKCLSQCVVHVYMLFSADTCPSHVLVMFLEEEGQPTAIVPVKRVVDHTAEDLREGVDCSVKWSDHKIYSTRVVAVGKSYTVNQEILALFWRKS